MTAARLRPALVADLAASAASSDPTRRFWAQYVVQLGRIADVPYDLLDPAVPGEALLDPAQVAFLTHRYQAELWLAGQRAGGLLPGALPRLGRAALPAGPLPCTMTETQQTVMDVAALGVSKFMGGVIDLASEGVPGAEKLSKFTAGADAALTIVKFLWTLAALDAKVTVAPARLVRKPDGRSEVDEALTATFQYTTGNAQVANCVRPALNTLGLDFSLPQDGPIAGARVDWEMSEVWERYQRTPILQYKDGVAPLRHTTDQNGQDTVTVQGTPRSTPLSGALQPDYRLVRFQAKVALKDTRMWQDIMDAVGAASAGNPASMALGLITETLLRMNSLVFAGRYNLVVRDLKPAADVAVHVQMAGTLEGTIDAGGAGSESAQTMVDLFREEAPGAAPLSFVVFTGYPTAGQVDLVESGYRLLSYQGSGSWTGPCVCAAGEGTDTWAGAYVAGKVTDAEPFTLWVGVQPDGSFSLDVPLGETSGEAKSRSSTEGCGSPVSYRDEKMAVTAGLGTVTITGTIDLSQPTGTIEGSFSGPWPVPVPGARGGFYSGGVAHPDIDATVVVDYRLAYAVQRVSLRAGEAPPASGPVARAAAAGPVAAVPAFTSWTATPDPARLACRAAGGP